MNRWRVRATWILAVLLLARAESVGAADGLSFIEAQRNGERGVTGLKGAQWVTVSPDGAHLYVAGSGDSAVAVFRRDRATGALTFVEEQRQGVGGLQGLGRAASVVISPDGAHVYAAGSLDNAVVVFSRDGATGGLSFVEMKRDKVDGVAGLAGVNALAVSPDGANVYAASGQDNALAVLHRDGVTGALTFVEMQREGTGAVRGLKGAQAVAVSPDGAHVYAVGGSDNAVAVFSRQAATGALRFVEAQRNTIAGVAGLAGGASVAVSSDGANVYVAGKVDQAIAVFRRDPATGALTFVEVDQQAVNGVDGLDGVNAVAVSPDGAHLYAVASAARTKTLAVFGRDATTGALTFRGRQMDGVGNVTGLDGAAAVAVSADGTYAYTAGKAANEVAVFSSRCGDGQLDPGEQCDDGNAVDGDGCSTGCRHECATVDDCRDHDRCTEGRCRSGECDFPRCGLVGGICQLTDVLTKTVPVLQSNAACTPTPLGLMHTTKLSLKEARVKIQVARTQGVCIRHGKNGDPCVRTTVLHVKELRKLLHHVDKTLTTVQRQASMLTKKKRISLACQATVDQTVSSLTKDLHNMVLHKALCAP